MKNRQKILVPILSLLALYSCSSPIEPKELAQTVLEALKAKDVNLAIGLILNADDYEDFYSNSSLDDSEKKRLIDKHSDPSYIAERKKRFKKRFQKIIENGEKKGIVWKNLTFEYIKGPKEKYYSGVQADEIYVFCSYNSEMYKLTLDDCYHTSRGWLMSDEPRFAEAKVK